MIEYVLSRGSLSEDLGPLDIEVEISVFFEHGFQGPYEVEWFWKWRYDIAVVCVSQTFRIRKFPKNAAPEVKRD